MMTIFDNQTPCGLCYNQQNVIAMEIKTEEVFQRKSQIVLDLVYQHTNEDEPDLLVKVKGNHLFLKNDNYDPQRAILSETLTIMFISVITKFPSSVSNIRIAISREIRTFRLIPWPTKTVNHEFEAEVSAIIIRGGRVLIRPSHPEQAGEWRRQLSQGYEPDGHEVWINPRIIAVTLDVNQIEIE